MSLNRILALSSSRVGNTGYLETAKPVIKNFLGDKPLNIAFIPFASVDTNYDDYLKKVQQGLSGLPYTIHLASPEIAVATIVQADVIMVGGGNTFKLLHNLYNLHLIDLIRDKVNNGTPYIGWSAGSNITGATIGTTNDMPIIQPKSFNALALFPFQINPHYINQKPVGHNGETRDQRLEEYIKMNPGLPVVCLPEGTALRAENDQLTFTGIVPGVLQYAEEGSSVIKKKEIAVDEDLSFLL